MAVVNYQSSLHNHVKESNLNGVQRSKIIYALQEYQKQKSINLLCKKIKHIFIESGSNNVEILEDIRKTILKSHVQEFNNLTENIINNSTAHERCQTTPASNTAHERCQTTPANNINGSYTLASTVPIHKRSQTAPIILSRATNSENMVRKSKRKQLNYLKDQFSFPSKSDIYSPNKPRYKCVTFHQPEQRKQDLGFTICGGANKSVYIKHVECDSVAEEKGLKCGDILIEVNGISLDNIKIHDASKLIAQSNEPKFIVKTSGTFDEYKKMSAINPWSGMTGTEDFHFKQVYEPHSPNQAVVGRMRSLKISQLENQPIGFNIRGGSEYGIGIYVTSVLDNSLADRSGLKVGDQIIELNGESFELITHSQAICFIKNQKSLALKVIARGKVPEGKHYIEEYSWITLDGQRILSRPGTPNESFERSDTADTYFGFPDLPVDSRLSGTMSPTNANFPLSTRPSSRAASPKRNTVSFSLDDPVTTQPPSRCKSPVQVKASRPSSPNHRSKRSSMASMKRPPNRSHARIPSPYNNSRLPSEGDSENSINNRTDQSSYLQCPSNKSNRTDIEANGISAHQQKDKKDLDYFTNSASPKIQQPQIRTANKRNSSRRRKTNHKNFADKGDSEYRIKEDHNGNNFTLDLANQECSTPKQNIQLKMQTDQSSTAIENEIDSRLNTERIINSISNSDLKINNAARKQTQRHPKASSLTDLSHLGELNLKSLDTKKFGSLNNLDGKKSFLRKQSEKVRNVLSWNKKRISLKDKEDKRNLFNSTLFDQKDEILLKLDEQLQTVLTVQEYKKVKTYLAEYLEKGNIDNFTNNLLSSLNTPGKHVLIAQIRNIVFPYEVSKFDSQVESLKQNIEEKLEESSTDDPPVKMHQKKGIFSLSKLSKKTGYKVNKKERTINGVRRDGRRYPANTLMEYTASTESLSSVTSQDIAPIIKIQQKDTDSFNGFFEPNIKNNKSKNHVWRRSKSAHDISMNKVNNNNDILPYQTKKVSPKVNNDQPVLAPNESPIIHNNSSENPMRRRSQSVGSFHYEMEPRNVVLRIETPGVYKKSESTYDNFEDSLYDSPYATVHSKDTKPTLNDIHSKTSSNAYINKINKGNPKKRSESEVSYIYEEVDIVFEDDDTTPTNNNNHFIFNKNETEARNSRTRSLHSRSSANSPTKEPLNKRHSSYLTSTSSSNISKTRSSSSLPKLTVEPSYTTVNTKAVKPLQVADSFNAYDVKLELADNENISISNVKINKPYKSHLYNKQISSTSSTSKSVSTFDDLRPDYDERPDFAIPERDYDIIADDLVFEPLNEEDDVFNSIYASVDKVRAQSNVSAQPNHQTSYHTIQLLKSFDSLGLSITGGTDRNPDIRIADIHDGTSAAQTNIKKGQLLVSLDGESLMELSHTDAVKKIRNSFNDKTLPYLELVVMDE